MFVALEYRNFEGAQRSLSFLTGRDSLVQLVPEDDDYATGEIGSPLQPRIVMKSGIVRSSLFAATDGANIPDSVAMQIADIFGGDVDFYQKILVGQGAVGTWLKAREGEAYKSSDEFFGGQPVWQNFSTWLAQVPDVNYGIFTSEVDSAISAQLPTIAQGGDLDAAIEAINAQATQATQ